MPLRSQLVDEQGTVLEQILFAQLEISDSIPRSELEPTINTDGFTLLRPRAAEEQTDEHLRLRAARVPEGFQLSATTHRPIAGSDYPVEHLVYSDGLATVSVFIEDPKSEPEVAAWYESLPDKEPEWDRAIGYESNRPTKSIMREILADYFYDGVLKALKKV